MRNDCLALHVASVAITIAALAHPVAAGAAPVKTGHVTAELVAEQQALVPGETATVALRLAIEPGWHTYWRNPGESGLPTTLEWHLPPGCSHVEIAGKQHHEACGMANAPGYAPGILSGPPE